MQILAIYSLLLEYSLVSTVEEAVSIQPLCLRKLLQLIYQLQTTVFLYLTIKTTILLTQEEWKRHKRVHNHQEQNRNQNRQMLIVVLWAVTLCSLVEKFQRKISPPPSGLKLEAIHSSAKLVTTYMTTWHHNAETILNISTAMRTSDLKSLGNI